MKEQIDQETQRTLSQRTTLGEVSEHTVAYKRPSDHPPIRLPTHNPSTHPQSINPPIIHQPTHNPSTHPQSINPPTIHQPIRNPSTHPQSINPPSPSSPPSVAPKFLASFEHKSCFFKDILTTWIPVSHHFKRTLNISIFKYLKLINNNNNRNY